MGWADHHEDFDFESKKREAEAYINARLGKYSGDGEDHKDVAREVSDRFGIALTPGEVKDIHRSGW